ncbi:carbohydrate kinase [Thalassococcus sp. S3]|uniref:carbohydrate kinase family protein n=1 Tax=Thalassococcus sp. S3 TaxID=2017482 RepID=UPI00102443A1|nr:carbohydrate kinase [Thalassococcus sp. S3]QBF32510.1 carbohydrate kinase [Thalassococcus sp. S3]
MILCCGEALIDMIPVVTDDGQILYRPHTGGAVFNTALALGRLGAEVGLLTGLSTDRFGDQLSAALRESAVDLSHVITSDRLTTLAMVHLQDGQASYSFYDENSAGRLLRTEDMPTLKAPVTALYFGGISLACEPAADAYAAVLQRERETRSIIVDPNVRLGFASDEGTYRHRLNRVISQADLVKVSDEDLDWIIAGSAPIEEKAAALRKMGPRIVVLTRGGDGATGFVRDQRVDVAAIKTESVDTVGAGDTFNAGLLFALQNMGRLGREELSALSASDLRDALEFGARVAAITVSRAGANPPWAHEL